MTHHLKLFDLAADGWCTQARRLPSPNCDARPDGMAIDLLVIHNISLPPGQFDGDAVVDFFLNKLDFDAHPYFDRLRELTVSAHFLIRRDGALLQFVSANNRAWHAGVSNFDGRERCNDFSIGIELEGSDFEKFNDAQYACLAKLTRALQQRYPLQAVVGHEHIAPARKTDPGAFFDWKRYRALLADFSPTRALRFPG